MIAYNLNDAVRKPKEVKKLYLRNIGLTELPMAIKEMENLKFLGLSKNRISDLPSWVEKLIRLEGLDLSENQFENIPNVVFELSNLKVINFAGNQLKKIPKAICKCTLLENITFQNNQISKIPKALFSEKIKHLDISNNQIVEIPETLQEAVKLERLYFSSNKISNLPAIDYSKLAISHIYLKDNNLKSLPDNIGHLKKLRDLIISRNKIKAIPESIGMCKYLWQINANQNKMEMLPSTLGSCNWLHELSFRKNNLKSVFDEIGGLKKLRKLNLEYNDLESLPNSLIDLDYLETLLLKGNDIQIAKSALIHLQRLKKITGLTDLFSSSEKKKFLTFLKYCRKGKIELTQRNQLFKLYSNNEKVSKNDLIVASNFPIPKIRQNALGQFFKFYNLKNVITPQSTLHFTGRTLRIKAKYFEELKQLNIQCETKYNQNVTHVILGDFPNKRTLENAKKVTFISEQDLLKFIQPNLEIITFSEEELTNLRRLLLSEHKENLLVAIQILEQTYIPSAFITDLFIAYKVCSFPTMRRSLRNFLMLNASPMLQDRLNTLIRLPKLILSENDKDKFIKYTEETELDQNKVIDFFTNRR